MIKDRSCPLKCFFLSSSAEMEELIDHLFTDILNQLIKSLKLNETDFEQLCL